MCCLCLCCLQGSWLQRLMNQTLKVGMGDGTILSTANRGRNADAAMTGHTGCRPMENEAAPETKCDAEKIVQLAACSALKYWHGMYRSSAPICGRFFARSSQLPVLLLCCKQQMPRDFCAQQKSWGGDGWFNKNSKHKGRLGVALKTQKSRGSLFTPPFFIGNVTENFALASGSHAMHWRPVCLHNSELLFRGRFGTRENWKI